MQQVTVLGSTGVIGRLTLDVLSHLGSEYSVAALSAGRNVERLVEQIVAFEPVYVSVQDEAVAGELRSLLPPGVRKPEIGVGHEGLVQAARISSDIVVSAVMGAIGLLPTWVAAQRGATIALANKETLVAGGDVIMPLIRENNVRLLPVDSEHSAIFQCLEAGGAGSDSVRRLLVTASGGPFRGWTEQDLANVRVEDALKHPTWNMGRKITIDSATLMNKGLEVIEAHHLFETPYDNIEVVVHPQSVIHSMVEFVDGSTVAQLGVPDMRLPIQYALTYPVRVPRPAVQLDFAALAKLTFEEPDMNRFPALHLAYEAGRAGGYAPCVLNAANEVAVHAFLAGELPFTAITKVVATALEKHSVGRPHSIEDLLEVDAVTRRQTLEILAESRWR